MAVWHKNGSYFKQKPVHTLPLEGTPLPATESRSQAQVLLCKRALSQIMARDLGIRPMQNAPYSH